MIAALAGRKVVIVHDWLTGMRGGEKVLESICRLAPRAEIITLVHVPHSVSPLIEAHRLRRSWLQWLPMAASRYREYLPLFPAAIEHFDLDEADVIISSSHCAAKSVVATGRAVHLCYCHSPMRYAWDQFEEYFGPDRLGRVGAAAARRVLAGLARWDRATAGRVDRYVANSAYVAGRIQRYYNRQASVLPPPVDTRYFTPGAAAPEAYFLVVSALVPYKRIDLAIRAATMLGVPLKIIGTGPDSARLKALAGANPDIHFLGRVDDETLRDAYRAAAAVVLPAEEDFGIVPVEALACGRPVIGFARGGVLETVENGVTGWLVTQQTPDAFADAMRRCDDLTSSVGDRQSAAQAFGVERFERDLGACIEATLATDSPW